MKKKGDLNDFKWPEDRRKATFCLELNVTVTQIITRYNQVVQKSISERTCQTLKELATAGEDHSKFHSCQLRTGT